MNVNVAMLGLSLRTIECVELEKDGKKVITVTSNLSSAIKDKWTQVGDTFNALQIEKGKDSVFLPLLSVRLK